MTTSPSDRALALVAKFERECTDDMCYADWVNGIAAAITQAENEKLEEARQRILEGHDEAWGNPAEQHGWDQAAERVAALISKKD